MPYRSLADAVTDLEHNRMLLRIPDEVDGHLEVAEIQRRAYAAGAPAILYERVKGSAFPCVSNLFGTMERARFLLRHGLDGAKAAVGYRAEPARPSRICGAALSSAQRRGGRDPFPAPAGRRRAQSGSPDFPLEGSADHLLAGRRGSVHHPAPGVHRGS